MSEAHKKLKEEKAAGYLREMPAYGLLTGQPLERQAEEARRKEQRLKDEYQRELQKYKRDLIERTQRLIEEEKKSSKVYEDIAYKHEFPSQFIQRIADISNDEDRHVRTLEDILRELKQL